MNVKSTEDTLQPFLAGGGEMGQLMRSKNWSETSLGHPDTWPQSLRTTLGIILHSKFPMFLWWGPELICFYNDAYRPSLGHNGKHPVILGMPAAEAWPEIWDIIKPLIDQVLANGKAVWSEDQLIPIYRNGTLEDVYWTFSYSPVSDESGSRTGVLVTCTETTEKVVNLQHLEESRKQLEFAIEASALGTFDYNPSTNKFSANDRLRSWFGLPPGEQVHLSQALNAIAEKDRQRVIDAIQHVLNSPAAEGYDIEYTIIHPVTKEKRVVRAMGRVGFTDDNVAYRFSGTLQDITKQKLIEQYLEKQVQERTRELAHNNIELSKINKELQSFAYISSHDLQEPLRKIQTFTSRLLAKEHGNLSEEGKDVFRRMQNAAERMQSLIDDLLAYSRTNTAERNYIKTHLSVILDEVKADLKEEMEQKNATLEVNGLCDLHIIPFQFRQLLQNLISNSLKFAQPGHAPHIVLHCEVAKGKTFNIDRLTDDIPYCHLSVSDKGIGFEQQYHERIFELFQRLHGKMEYNGTGIGLAIVKKIVENHNGIIVAKGEINKGATFDIYIPFTE
jgi:signal transduction histidine kinase